MTPAAFAIPGDIATATGGFIYERRLLEELRAAGRTVDHLVLDASFPDPTPAAMADAVRQLRAVPPDRPLILDGLVFGSIATEGLAQLRAPVVAMIHHPLALESGLSDAARAHLFRTERDNLRLAAHVLVPSPHTASILTGDYAVPPGRITVARPGLDPIPGRPAPVAPPLILSVGILHPRKGHDVLLRALAEIRALDWQAVIVGGAHDPEHAAALPRLAGALGLDRRVRLSGRVARSEIGALYRSATLFALATHYEGYGLVFDEALSCGLPIVSCRTGAVPDTVPPAAGLLVSPGDAAGFAAALRTLLTDPEGRARMAAAAAAAAAALPRWADTARTAGAVLDRLAARRGT